jgi:hypothetical protein
VQIAQALTLFDEGMALPNVIDHLLSNARDRQIEVGTTLVKAALAMPDGSGHRIHTPVKKEIGSGCLVVGDTIISIMGSPCEGYEGEMQQRILLSTRESQSPSVVCDSRRTTCQELSHFVAQIVLLRAVGSNQVMRNWLANALD